MQDNELRNIGPKQKRQLIEIEHDLQQQRKQMSARGKMVTRVIAWTIVVLGALLIAVGFSACTNNEYDDFSPEEEWYFSGVWQSGSASDENLIFYSNGTGYWESMGSGEDVDFDYYCYGDNIVFKFYPSGTQPYSVTARITFTNSGNMTIFWPAGSFYGARTFHYRRID